MRVPRFWAAAEGSDVDSTGERFLYRRVWGWSMASAADALAVAHERLRSVLAQVGSGGRVGAYYPRVPLREPLLDEEIVDDEQVYALTRNRYGAEILNTDRVLIADVDLPELEDWRPPRIGLFRRLFGRSEPLPQQPTEPQVVVERLATLANWAFINYSYGVIVYRTASGLRVFVTGVSEPTTSAEGERILVELEADPIYRELCRNHGTFRARLTPKPWRLRRRMWPPSGRWPFESERAERRFERWLSSYETASQGYAVCRRLAAHGLPPSALERQIIELHDERTRVSTTLPLA
jgi:hypothetical protein